jgi:hypothetical protein
MQPYIGRSNVDKMMYTPMRQDLMVTWSAAVNLLLPRETHAVASAFSSRFRAFKTSWRCPIARYSPVCCALISIRVGVWRFGRQTFTGPAAFRGHGQDEQTDGFCGQAEIVRATMVLGSGSSYDMESSRSLVRRT